ncbi:hypothetical protein LTR08_007776 [Meristemomyces frigidus]|nr:hypothetical protein LTR08_007776 [Meristemomyces frigidus]
MPNGLSLVPTSELQLLGTTLVDGSRVGFQDDYSVALGANPKLTGILQEYTGVGFDFLNSTYWNLTHATGEFSEPPANIPFSFALLPGLPINTSTGAYETMDSYYRNLIWNHIASNITLDGRLWELKPPPLNVTFPNRNYPFYPHAAVYSTGNSTTGITTITGDWMKQPGHSFCIPSNDYQWGFSLLMLFAFCIYTAVFACVLGALHWDYEWHSRASRYEHHNSVYRDALDLSSELRTQSGHYDVEGMSAKDIDDYVKQHKGAVRLDVDQLPLSRSEQRQNRRRKRKRSRKSSAAGFGRSKYHLVERVGTLLPAFMKGPTVREESMELRLTSTSEPVFEGT